MNGKHFKAKDFGIIDNFKYRKRWKSFNAALSILVALVTIAALMLPAITVVKNALRSTQDLALAANLEIENADHGPNKLLVDWYVYLDRKWTKVGSTRTGWQATASGNTYDYISEGQAKYILEKYGFTGGETGYHDLAYRKIDIYGAEPVLERGIFDVTGFTDGDGKHFYRLSTEVETDSYCVYFVPNTEETLTDENGSENTVYSKCGDGIAVYTVEVYDPENVVYEEGKARPVFYAVHGTTIDFTVLAPAQGSSWCLHRPNLTDVAVIAPDTITDNGDGTVTFPITVEQTLYVAEHNTVHTAGTVIQSIPPDDLRVNYYVYIEDEWRLVGITHNGWTISGREAAGGSCYDDPNYSSSGSTQSNFYPDGAGYKRDVISMTQVTEVLGKYGFSPAVADDFKLESSGSTPRNDNYRIKNIGYEKLDNTANKTVYYDTYYDSFEGVLIYPLSQVTVDGKVTTPREGYNIYFAPDNATSSYTDGKNNTTLKNAATIERKDINYYVHLDGAWTKVGTSHYYNPGSSSDRDKIGVSQMYEYFKPYGFPENGPTNGKELYYSVNSGTFYNNTEIKNGWYSLTTSGDRPSAYNIYWMPDQTKSENGVSTPAVIDSGRFYLFQVYEPSNMVYDSLELAPKVYVRHGNEGTLTVKKADGNDWVVKSLDRNETLTEIKIDGDGGYYKRVDNNDGTWTYIIPNMTKTAIVAFPYTNLDRSLSNNYSDNTNSVSIKDVVSDPNIKFTMHNYSTSINELLREKGLASFTDGTMVNSSGETVYQGQNEKRTYFSFRGAGGTGVGYNALLDNDPFQKNHATVKRNLLNGYPAIDVTHHGYTTAEKLKSKGFSDDDIAAWKAADKTSLGFLFGEDGTAVEGQNGVTKIGNGQKTYVMNYLNNVNTPLQILNGKYQYFSYFNAADFNTAQQKWYVRNYVERTESTSSYLTKDDYGDFLPFNHSGGELIPERAYNFYQEDVDYWYGMTMSTQFYMSENGDTDTGPMIFGFAGDDDVYVFVDGKLVLDIGGTHGSCTGTINFKTGLVAAYYDFNGESAGPKSLINSTDAALQTDPYTNVEYNRYYATTIYEAYKAAMQEAGMSEAEIEAELEEIFVPVFDENGQQAIVKDNLNKDSFPIYRFKNFSTHDLNYYYMERGSSVANCNIQFNLSTLPTENLTVSKAVDYEILNPTDDDKIFYTTAEKHSFRIIDSKTKVPLSGSIGYVYPVTTDTGLAAGTVTADRNGIFQISAGQRVTVKDINEWLLTDNAEGYIVQELIPKSHVLSNTPVDINGVEVEGGDSITIAGVEYIPYDFKAVIGSGDNNVVFTPYTNLRSLEKVGYLVIEKDVGGLQTDSEFSVKVSINGEPLPKDTKFYILTGNTDSGDNIVNDQKFVRADADGVVKIKAGIKYRLGTKLIKGYKFTVEEVNIPDGWAFDSYTVDGVKQTTTAAGTIAADTTHTVVVKNISAGINLNVSLSKQFTGMDWGDTKSRTAQFEARQVTGNDGLTEVTNPLIPNPTVSITCKGNVINSANLQLAFPKNTENGTYYYSVSETGITVQEGEAFFNDDSVFVLEVVISSGGEKQKAEVTEIYKNGVKLQGSDDSAELINGVARLNFINRKGGEILPSTGGIGTDVFIYGGIALMLLALVGMGINLFRHLKGDI